MPGQCEPGAAEQDDVHQERRDAADLWSLRRIQPTMTVQTNCATRRPPKTANPFDESRTARPEPCQAIACTIAIAR